MKLMEPIIETLMIAKVFRDNTDKVNNLSFTENGDTIITSSDDDQIILYDCEKACQKKALNSKKYGVDLITFTHHKSSVLHASTRIDDHIRYLSLHDNKYIRYFQGHQKKVVTLCTSPVDDTFISGAMDKTLRLWDLRSPGAHGLMHVNGRPVAAFDPEGLIFGAGVNSECIKLFDLRSFDKGPFVTFQVRQERECDWTGLRFSPDGKSILVSTNGSVFRLVDAFNGTPKQTFAGHVNNKGIPLEACYTPDSKFIFCGSTDGTVHAWNAETGMKIIAMNAKHTGPVQCVRFNPKYMMMASACTNVAFWLPNVSENC